MRCSKRTIILLCLLVFSLSLLPACTNNQNAAQDISAISSDDPRIGFWVALQAEENVIDADVPFTAKISFGTRARNLERFIITISSEDFEIIKSCPDEYVVDGKEYSDDDFYVNASSKIFADDLPQNFTISLTPKLGGEIYSGSTDIVITEYLVGGHSTGTVTLYYYGDNSHICFSSKSQQEAKNIFDSKIN